MCSSIKSDPSVSINKKPYKSFMAGMTLAQRAQFAEVANRADERHHLRMQRRQRQQQQQAKLQQQRRQQASWWQNRMEDLQQVFA